MLVPIKACPLGAPPPPVERVSPLPIKSPPPLPSPVRALVPPTDPSLGLPPPQATEPGPLPQALPWAQEFHAARIPAAGILSPQQQQLARRMWRLLTERPYPESSSESDQADAQSEDGNSSSDGTGRHVEDTVWQQSPAEQRTSFASNQWEPLMACPLQPPPPPPPALTRASLPKNPPPQVTTIGAARPEAPSAERILADAHVLAGRGSLDSNTAQIISAATHYQSLRRIPGGTVRAFDIKCTADYLGVYFHVPWDPHAIRAHITLIKGNLHGRPEDGMDRLSQLLNDLFSEDIDLTPSSLQCIFTNGRRPTVRRVLLLCHMVAKSARQLWACRNFAIQTWQVEESNRREFHISFDSIRLAVRIANTDHVDPAVRLTFRSPASG